MDPQGAVFAANRATGTVRLGVGLREGAGRHTQSCRTHVFEEGSLRVRFPNPVRPSPALDAVLVNTAGGIAGGDRSDIDIAVEEGASVRVTTSSAEKVYRATGAPAHMQVRLTVGRGGNLAWMPREMILFDRARLARTIDVDLADDARLLLAEAVVFGRTGMDEAVHEGWFSDRWRVRRAGRLVYAETMRLDGAIAQTLREPAVAGGGVAVAVILLMPADEAFVAALRGCEGLRGEVGASSWNGITAVRFCAPDGESLRYDLATALPLALDGPLPPLWLN
ncbi:urease accessory protein ureD [Rhodoplanes elegans]|uniref:Urease accessory protein UreD n=1 Tax=Rhodoplanes elegans TaxID=29408 RepID=A0A327KBL6_9BRAD|nr:urease accessory protein ureD [Rhodoplanes elegans]RAI35013.1 urease accessory protein ureD [Rhodoplanes elegans]